MSNLEEEEFYRQKYLKYKAKYLEAKKQMAGQPTEKPCKDYWIKMTCPTSDKHKRSQKCIWDEFYSLCQNYN